MFTSITIYSLSNLNENYWFKFVFKILFKLFKFDKRTVHNKF